MRYLAFFIISLLIIQGCSKDSDPAAPETPRGLTVINSDLFSISLSWNISDNATEYILYRSESGIADFIVIYEGPDTNFADTELPFATTYYYKVSAKNEGGESIPSMAVSRSTLIPDGFEVTLSPDGNADLTYYYDDDFNGKPRYKSYPVIGMSIFTPSSGNYKDLWVIFYSIESDVMYYHPDISDYPPSTGWLKSIDNSETNILLTPILN